MHMRVFLMAIEPGNKRTSDLSVGSNHRLILIMEFKGTEALLAMKLIIRTGQGAFLLARKLSIKLRAN